MKSLSVKAPLFQEPVSISICFLNDIQIPFEELKAKIPTLNCALINPKLVASYDQLTTAIMKVLVSGSSMKTRSRYTELLYNLSPSTNVTESLKLFGLGEGNSVAVAVRFDCEDGEAFANELEEKLSCTAIEYDASLFEKHSNPELVKSTYKLTTNSPLELCTIISSKGF